MNLQDVVDQLAGTLARSVVISILTYEAAENSDGSDEIEEIRTFATLKRDAMARAEAGAGSDRGRHPAGPLAVGLGTFVAEERLSVPIRDDESTLATLWLITGGLPPLTAVDYAAIDAAVALARDILGTGMRSRIHAARRRLAHDLLSADSDTRRAAFAEALRSAVVSREQDTAVLAVTLDASSAELDRLALARRLTLQNAGMDFVTERGGRLVFLVRGAVADAVDSVRAELGGVPPMGSAPLDGDDDDLLPVVEDAALAADIAASVPSLGGYADLTEVGVWALLASPDVGPGRLRRCSPAAHALIAGGDEVQRETVEVYLDAGASVRVACRLLHLHRTTLYYRLEHLPEVVRDALEDGVKRTTLHLCLKRAKLAG